MTNHRLAVVIAAVQLALAAQAVAAALPDQSAGAPPPPSVAVLLEDNADTLLPLLTNPTGDPGQGFVEQFETFSGRSAVRIVPMQRFHPHIPGWDYHIVEKPAGPNEYRYVRFAWKSDGCVGTMVQFHIATGWSIRYCAGQNVPGWGSKFVAPRPPARWTVVTRDLFADFGECVVTGIALTAFEGRAAYFDHVYFGRTLGDLDRIDSTGVLRQHRPFTLGPVELERLWIDLCGDEAQRSYLARWTLVSDPERAAPFLKQKALSLSPPDELPALVRRWVAELGSDRVRVREAASEQLARHVGAAADLLREEAQASASPEVRARAATVLREADLRGPWPDAAVEVVRALQVMGTPEARRSLEELAGGLPGATATEAARNALKDGGGGGQ